MTSAVADDYPSHAGWTLQGDRVGWEATSIERRPSGWAFLGSTTAVENGLGWHVAYELVLDAQGITRFAEVHTRTGITARSTVVTHDGAGRWTVNGLAAAALTGCLDVDLEASALTNAFPVRRIVSSAATARQAAPAAYVRVLEPRVERLEQWYRRLDVRTRPGFEFEYQAPAFDFACQISYDLSGLVLNYPTIATRIRHEP